MKYEFRLSIDGSDFIVKEIVDIELDAYSDNGLEKQVKINQAYHHWMMRKLNMEIIEEKKK